VNLIHGADRGFGHAPQTGGWCDVALKARRHSREIHRRLETSRPRGPCSCADRSSTCHRAMEPFLNRRRSISVVGVASFDARPRRNRSCAVNEACAKCSSLALPDLPNESSRAEATMSRRHVVGRFGLSHEPEFEPSPFEIVRLSRTELFTNTGLKHERDAPHPCFPQARRMHRFRAVEITRGDRDWVLSGLL